MASTELSSIERDKSHLVIEYGSADQITVPNFFYDPSYAIEQIKFSDGVVWNTTEIEDAVTAFKGTPSADTFSEKAVTDQLNNRKITQFDFDGLVNTVDNSVAATPNLTS